MDRRERTRLSKLLSYHLRHDPGALGLSLAAGGWVPIDALLAALATHGRPMSRSDLNEIVATSEKRRFAIDDGGLRIRANQGHSTEVDLQLEPATPPAVLFHGATDAAVPAILRDGLLKMARHHVHLSADAATAHDVGGRRGRAVVFTVDAAGMRAAGATFYRAANGVWLVDAVPPRFLQRLK